MTLRLSRRACLRNTMRTLWEQHVYWTRMFIISAAADSADLQLTTARLMQNPKDFAAALTPYYGKTQSRRFEKLLTEHLSIAGDLVMAAKKGDTKTVDEKRKLWYKNADDISALLASINPHWTKKQWQTLFYDHLKMTENEAALRLAGQYEQDVGQFNEIEQEALKMADTMTNGMARQFSI